jgi:hypothetical protein
VAFARRSDRPTVLPRAGDADEWGRQPKSPVRYAFSDAESARRHVRFAQQPHDLSISFSRKIHADACREQDVVFLVIGKGVTQVSVTHGELPGQPFIQICHSAQVEVDSVRTQVSEIVKHSE